jgi:hypothetical protein
MEVKFQTTAIQWLKFKKRPGGIRTDDLLFLRRRLHQIRYKTQKGWALHTNLLKVQRAYIFF